MREKRGRVVAKFPRHSGRALGVSQGGAWGHRQGGLQDPLGVPLIKLMPGVRECLTAEFMPALRTGLAYQSVLARGNREINSVGFEKRGINGVFPARVRSRRACTAIPVRKGAWPPMQSSRQLGDELMPFRL